MAKGGSGELGERICSSGEIFSFKSIKGKWTGNERGNGKCYILFIGTDLWLIFIFQGLKYWFNDVHFPSMFQSPGFIYTNVAGWLGGWLAGCHTPVWYQNG